VVIIADDEFTIRGEGLVEVLAGSEGSGEDGDGCYGGTN